MTRVINQKMDIRFFQTFLPFLISLLCFSLWNATQAQPKGSDPLFLIKQHGKYGYIDSKGQIVIQPQYDFAWGFSEGLASVWIGDRAGYVDLTGNMIISPKFRYARAFRNGCAEVEVSGKWGLIDPRGEYIAKPQYKDIRCFSDGLAPAQIAGKWGYINKTGQFVWEGSDEGW